MGDGCSKETPANDDAVARDWQNSGYRSYG